MNILNFLKKKENTEERSNSFASLLYNCLGGYKANKALLLSTAYRCVDVISDSVAQLPLEPYHITKDGFKDKYFSHPSYTLLNKEPNQNMSRFTFIKTLIVNTLLKGNGYAYIERDEKGNATALRLLDPEMVTILKPLNVGDSIRYSYTGLKGLIEACNMIHILNFTYNGYEGVSTLTHARQTLGIALDSESAAGGFFRGGCNLAGILKVNGAKLKKDAKEELKASWNSAFNPTTGTPNGVAVLDGDMEYQSVQMNSADAQLLESRLFNVIDICRFFGVNPVKVFDLSHSSYSTVEATQLAFLTDTLSPLLEKIELEFERKLYKPSEKDSISVRFDTSVLLRADKSSLASYYKELFYLGVMSPNDIRKELDLPAIEGGDSHFMQVNLQTLDNAVTNTNNTNDGTEGFKE